MQAGRRQLGTFIRHEHLVRINDPANAAGVWLTRAQLWEGLRHTVAVPQALDESIETAAVLECSPTLLKRELRRSGSSAFDEVDLIENESIVIRADANSPFCGSRLTIRIEEPQAEMLFVRFTYELHGLEPDRESEEDTTRFCAYEAYDIERVRAARRHAACAYRVQ
jgi:hypothetical protein